jgi:phosphopantetheinyl transferase
MINKVLKINFLVVRCPLPAYHSSFIITPFIIHNRIIHHSKKMPLLRSHHPTPTCIFGIWHIAEDEQFFRQDLPLSDVEAAELALHKGLRRLEWLAGRWLLHHLSGAPQRMPLAKDAFSKPFFPAHQGLQCSLSHSKGIVAALLCRPPDETALCGCDIQVLVEKMQRIAPRFLHPEERNFVEKHSKDAQFDLIHAFWTAKESMYKAYGLKALDFSDHIRLLPFEWQPAGSKAQGFVEKDGLRLDFDLQLQKMPLAQDQALLCCTCFSQT